METLKVTTIGQPSFNQLSKTDMEYFIQDLECEIRNYFLQKESEPP